MSSDPPPLPPGKGRGEGLNQPRPRIKQARKLRRNATPAERKLWPLLRSRSLVRTKFRRQYPCGPYVLDFADFWAKLAIELDGDTHATDSGLARDARRSAWLASQGWRVLRFSNRDVFADTDGVLQTIAAALGEAPHPGPLPGGEGE
jgi:very-short-patch-repair endonuclease